MTTNNLPLTEAEARSALESPVVSGGRPRIGFISFCGRNDRSHYSGVPFYLARAFERLAAREDFEFVYLGPIENNPAIVRRLRWRQRFEYRLSGRLSRDEYYPPQTRHHAREARRLMAGRRFDLLVGNWTWHGLLADVAPVVLLRDATIRGLQEQDGYDYFRKFSGMSRTWCEELERLAARKCEVQFFTSQWAAQSAVRDFGASERSVAIAPFGAGFDELPSRFEVLRDINGRGSDICRLLFIGLEWERKGGPLALEIVESLNRLGVAARLDVIGVAQDEVPASACVKVHGKLRKDDAAQRGLLLRLLREAHYLCVPSRAECFGIVYAEASAFGVPSIARDIGGVAGAVCEKNGFLFATQNAGKIAAVIAENFRDAEQYMHLARSARQHFEEYLNWDATARTMLERSRVFDNYRRVSQLVASSMLSRAKAEPVPAMP